MVENIICTFNHIHLLYLTETGVLMSIPDLYLQLWWTTWKPSHQAEQSLALGTLDPVLRGTENWEERGLASTSITTKCTISGNITLKIKRETGESSLACLQVSSSCDPVACIEAHGLFL